MSRFIHGIVIAATPMLIALVDTIALPAAASPNCMTQEEARKAFPRDHLYWHGPKRCWDNVGKSRSRKPAADADAAPAPSASGKSATAPPVPFIGDDPSGVASWSVSALAVPAPAPQVKPPPQPAPAAQEEVANAEDAKVVIGAPNATPGSPDYLLEHCCWPPTLPKEQTSEALLPRMVVASASACGLAVGLWLFVYRRRRPVRERWS